MNPKRRPTIDGFVPRRPGSQLGERHAPRAPQPDTAHGLRPVRPETPAQPGTLRPSSAAVIRSEIDESLKSIDTSEEPLKGRKGRHKKGAPKSKARRIIKWVSIALVVMLVIIGAWVAYKALIASNSIFKGNIFDIVQSQPLKQDANGRSNILLLGTSEDDPGHGGAYLTDSMMIMSINHKGKTVDMFSIPRDLYIKYGMACNSGYQGKINEYFNCVNDDHDSPSAEEQRMTETRKLVGDIFGLDVQYGVHVNNTVIKEAVNAVGGIDVDIQGSNGDPGVYDRNFDWRCGYKCYYVKYDNGIHHLDGERALYLAMARGHTAPTYGLGNSNFDREKNQQKIIVALKKKAASTGTLTDIGKVTGLIDALGNNLRTNFETKEIRTLMQIASDVKSENIKSVSLFDTNGGVVKSAPYNGASVVMPTAGVFEYSEIREFIKKKFSTNPVTREEAQVVVLNGSGVAGVAQTEADKLSDAGFIISGIDNAPEGTYAAVEVYQIGEGKPATKAKLESTFKVKVKTTPSPVSVSEGTDFIVIIGKERHVQTR